MKVNATAHLLRLDVFLWLAIICYAWWPFSNVEEKQESKIKSPQIEHVAEFEVKSVEEKFLHEAQPLLSPLNQCQNKVVSMLRTSCGEMNDETLGKLSVNLFNCQSEAEKRKLYHCTDAMTLAECTAPMDSTAWNAYHIISNRARSVCYSIQQQLFRRQSELVVNKLLHSNLKQLNIMKEIESSHKLIKDISEESLKSFNEHQDILATQQQEIKAAQGLLTDNIKKNLDELAQEKNMIQNGQNLLASMTEGIKNQLEEASLMLAEQEKKREGSHEEMVKEIDEIKRNIHHVWQGIDSSTDELQVQMEGMRQQYEKMQDNIKVMDSSLSSMAAMITSIGSSINHNFDWTINLLGGAQEGLHVLTTLVSHGAYFFVATFCLVFLKAPALIRATLLLMVVANSLMEIKLHRSLPLGILAVVQVLLLIGNWLYSWGNWLYVHCYSKKSPTIDKHPPSPIAALDCKTSNFSIKQDWKEENSSHSPFNYTAPIHFSTPLKRPPLLRISASNKCQALTKAGLRCKLTARPGSSTCARHS